MNEIAHLGFALKVTVNSRKKDAPLALVQMLRKLAEARERPDVTPAGGQRRRIRRSSVGAEYLSKREALVTKRSAASSVSVET
jgi:hypothetical protein